MLLFLFYFDTALGRQYKIRSIAAIGYKAKGDEVRISGSAAKVTFDIVIP